MTRNRILLVDDNQHKALPHVSAFSIIDGNNCLETSVEAAIEKLKEHKWFAIISNCASKELFEAADCHRILVTDQNLIDYQKSLGNLATVEHVIANREPWVRMDIRVCLDALTTNKPFGISRYLQPNTEIHEIKVESTRQRDFANNNIEKFAKEMKVPSYVCSNVRAISEELLMNAVYDAPDAAGVERFANLPRNQDVELNPHEQPTLTYGSDQSIFAIGVSDPFGAFSKNKFFSYLKKVVDRHNTVDIIDTNKEGAGLGILKVYFSSHAIICNVNETIETQMIVLIDLSEKIRGFDNMSRSVHFYPIQEDI